VSFGGEPTTLQSYSGINFGATSNQPGGTNGANGASVIGFWMCGYANPAVMDTLYLAADKPGLPNLYKYTLGTTLW